MITPHPSFHLRRHSMNAVLRCLAPVALLSMLSLSAAKAQDLTAIRAGKLLTMADGTIENAVVLIENGPAFYVAMAVWGFSFWMAVPRVLRLLAQRSYAPDERVGDAQAGMAVGRAIGPAVGAGFAASSRFVALGVLAASGVGLAGSAVAGVEVYRRRGGDADVRPREPMRRWRLPNQRKAA